MSPFTRMTNPNLSLGYELVDGDVFHNLIIPNPKKVEINQHFKMMKIGLYFKSTQLQWSRCDWTILFRK